MELIIKNLSKTYTNGVQALKNLSLEIPKGMFGLLGRMEQENQRLCEQLQPYRKQIMEQSTSTE